MITYYCFIVFSLVVSDFYPVTNVVGSIKEAKVEGSPQ